MGIQLGPSFGYRTVAHLLGFNKNTVQHIFQLKGWQVKKRAVGFRPRIQALPSVATASDECWSTDLCRIWAGRDRWATLALVIDCHTRELLGWHLSRSGKATTAGSALEHALIARFGTFGAGARAVPASVGQRTKCKCGARQKAIGILAPYKAHHAKSKQHVSQPVPHATGQISSPQ